MSDISAIPDSEPLNSFFLSSAEMEELLRRANVAQQNQEEARQFISQNLLSYLLHTDNVLTLQKMVKRGFSLDSFSITEKPPYKISGNHALFQSIQYKSYNIFNYLLTLNIDVNAIDNNFKGSPLLFAAYKNENYFVEQLLKHGADPNYIAPNKETVFFYLFRNGRYPSFNAELVKKVIESKELMAEFLHSPCSKDADCTIFQQFLYNYPTEIFDTLLQSIHTPATLFTLREPVQTFSKLSVIQTFPPQQQEQIRLASQKLESRICEIERNQLSQELGIAKDTAKTVLKI